MELADDPSPAAQPRPADEPSTVAPTAAEVTGYTDAGVPTFDHVRERIEGRAATAIGAEELASETPEVRALAKQEADRDAAGRDKLEEIRRSMRGDP